MLFVIWNRWKVIRNLWIVIAYPLLLCLMMKRNVSHQTTKGLYQQVCLIRLLNKTILTSTISMIFNNIDNTYIMCLSLLTSVSRLIYFFNYIGTSIVLLVLQCSIRFNIDYRVLQLSSLLANSS